MNSEIDHLNVPILANEHQSPPASTPKSKLTKRIIIPSVGTGVLALGIISFFCIFNPEPVPVIPPSPPPGPPPETLYSVIIDAGSSGSRVHVFKYSISESGEPVYNFGTDHYNSLDFNDGVSTFANNIAGLKAEVQKYVDFAKENVPEPVRHKSDIRLMATAGMRLLTSEEAKREILDATKEVLGDSGFHFENEWADIIPGSDEGLYAWIIANYASRSLGSEPSQTTGILELGGASAQVTFVSNDPVVSPQDSFDKYYNTSVPYKIYSHSFPNSGKDAAIVRLMDKLQDSATGNEMVLDPCTPRGYTYGNNAQKYLSVFLADESEYTKLEAAGNFEQCKTKTDQLWAESIGSTYTPPLQGDFLAISNFFFTGKFFDLDQKKWLSQLTAKGVEYCETDWVDLKRRYENPICKQEYLRGYCFSAAYIMSMMGKLNVDNNNERIKYSNKENEISLSWVLGAFINITSPSTVPAPSPSSAPSPSYVNGGNSRKFLGFF